MSSHGDPSILWGWKNWRSLAADHPLFWATIVVNQVNKPHWYWEQRMVKLIVNEIKSLSTGIINSTAKPEKKNCVCKNLYDDSFCRRKTNIGRHLRRHCRMPPPIPMAEAKKHPLSRTPLCQTFTISNQLFNLLNCFSLVISNFCSNF